MSQRTKQHHLVRKRMFQIRNQVDIELTLRSISYSSTIAFLQHNFFQIVAALKLYGIFYCKSITVCNMYNLKNYFTVYTKTGQQQPWDSQYETGYTVQFTAIV